MRICISLALFSFHLHVVEWHVDLLVKISYLLVPSRGTKRALTFSKLDSWIQKPFLLQMSVYISTSTNLIDPFIRTSLIF